SIATLGVVVLVGLAAGVLARGDIAPPRPAEPAAPGGAPAAAASGSPARGPDRSSWPPPAPPAGREAAATASREPAGTAGAAGAVGTTGSAGTGTGDAQRSVPRPSDAALPRAPHRDRAERTTRPAPTARTGELAIIVRPWAMIWLNGKPSGQTPFRAPVPAGRYRVRLANDDAGRDEVMTVTVEPDRTAIVERSW